MTRRRYVSTKISLDRKINDLAAESDFAALLYTWLIPHAEDDGLIHTGDVDELAMMVMPGRRDKKAPEFEAALEAAELHGLLRWHDGCIEFPVEAFYSHQTYVRAEKRRTTPISCTCDKHRTSAENSAERRPAAEIGASPSPSPSPSPPYPPLQPGSVNRADRLLEVWADLVKTKPTEAWRKRRLNAAVDFVRQHPELSEEEASGFFRWARRDGCIEPGGWASWWPKYEAVPKKVVVPDCERCNNTRLVGFLEDGSEVPSDDLDAVAVRQCRCVKEAK